MKNANLVHLHLHSSFCLAGETVIYNCLTQGPRNDFTRKKNSKTIEELYINLNKKNKGGTTKYSIKVFDGEKFVPSRIKYVYKSTNPKTFYKITTESGKSIKASRLHKFLTKDGWAILGNLRVGDYLACNGIPLYDDYGWLYNKYHNENLNQEEIAKICNVSRSVIKNRIKKFGIHKTKHDWMQNHYVSENTKLKLKEMHARRRLEITEPSKTEHGARFRTRRDFKYLYNKNCAWCGKDGKVEIHHKDKNPFNDDPSNLVQLCTKCHQRHHHLKPFTVQYEKITNIEYAGVGIAYDIEVKHLAHNFVANGFVVHNSLLDGLGKVDEYARKASELGFTHLAITDHGTVNGAIKFQRACEKHGIKSILGCEIYIVEDATVKDKNNGHMVVLVKNEQGWQNLLKMLSYAHLKGFFYKPRISYETILNHHEGLIITSACAHSWLLQPSGRKLLCELLEKKANEDIYLEIMPHNDKMTMEANSKFIRMSNKFDIPLLATIDCHYVNREDADAHEVLLAIQRGAKWDDKDRWKFSVKTLYLQSADEMISSFERQNTIDSKIYTRAMRNTMEVALLCEDFKIESKTPKLPRIKGVKKEDEEKKLRELCTRGFIDKVGEFMSVDYETRLDYEISILREKKAIRYFLLVWDLVNWCRENNILVSSRGSVGCSLIAYLIGITEIDPIKYNLPFSRFLNEDRIDLPDIDLDLPDNKRHLVTARLHELYGENHIAGISTFNRMKARGVIRDVARVFDVSTNEVDWFAKKIESSIEEALETDEGEEFARKNPKIIKYAQALENTEKSLGRHAAGKIISSEDLTLGTRAYLCMREDELTVNWEGEDCEHQGLIKLDILGLNTLTVIAEAISLIKKNHSMIVNFFKIPLDDPKIYKELSSGRFAGIFQMGYAVRNLVNEMGVSNIKEWSDAVALARPGPLDSGMSEEYVKRKRGADWERKHNLYEELLQETYGVVCIHEDTLIALENGSHIPIKFLSKGDYVISVNETTKLTEPKQCIECKPTRFCKGVKITLRSGHSIVLTHDHKILTYNGFKRVDELGADDIICVPHKTRSKLYSQDIASWLGDNINVAYMVGYATGNGCLSNSGTSLACGTEEKADIILDWIEQTFPKIKAKKYFNVRCWYISIQVDDLALEKFYGNRKKLWTVFLEKMLIKCKSIDKEISSIIMSSPEDVQYSFLAGIFDSDGHISLNNTNSLSCHISSSSVHIRNSLSKILQNLGIVHAIGANHVFIWSIKTFLSGIKPFSKIKQCNFETKQDGLYSGCIPSSEMFEAKNRSKLTERQFESKFGISRSMLHSNRKYISRALAYRLGINNGDLNFYEIKSIEEYPESKFYGVSVEDNHNLIANNIVISNCYQEQVMNIIHKVAGLSYATADKIRKVIGKKRDVREFEPYRKEFTKGCLKNQTLSQDEIEEFWEGLLKHSRYSFNHSHSLSYAILGYKCLWLLRYFPLEFICAALSYGTDKIKEEMLDEARKINIKIVPPKYGISAPKEWIVKNQKLYAPYVMIKGIGEKLAEEINHEPVKKKKGFFSSSSNTELKPKVRTILEAINAFNLDSDELPDEASIYFDIDFCKYTEHDDLFIQKQDPFEINEDLFECTSCELCNECDRQVPPSPSRYNLMIIGEAPGKDEDKIGKGFTGKAGKLLWEELAKHQLLRKHFHTTNTTKCFPSKSRNPSEKQVNACAKWLDEEINFVKPAIILALGNMAMYRLKGESKGIMRMNGTLEWNSKVGSFVLYSVHPALILRNPNYHEMFSKSIETLANKIKELSK